MACDLVDQCRPLSTEGDHARKLRRNDIRSHIRGKDIAKLNSLVPALQKRDRGFGFKLKPHFSIEIARVAYPSTSCSYRCDQGALLMHLDCSCALVRPLDGHGHTKVPPQVWT